MTRDDLLELDLAARDWLVSAERNDDPQVIRFARERFQKLCTPQTAIELARLALAALDAGELQRYSPVAMHGAMLPSDDGEWIRADELAAVIGRDK